MSEAIPTLLDEKYANRPESNNLPINSIEDLVLVHITNYAPSNSTIIPNIKTSFEFCIRGNNDEHMGNSPFELKWKHHRNTVHFSVNGCVVDGMKGTILEKDNTWTERKYAIIIPMKDAMGNQLASCMRETDVYFVGDFEIPDGAYLLCPEDEIDLIKSKNPNLNVVAYKGTNVKSYVNNFITLIGFDYKPLTEDKPWQEPSTFIDADNNTQFCNLVSRLGRQYSNHYTSKEMMEELRNTYSEMILNARDMIKPIGELLKFKASDDFHFRYWVMMDVIGIDKILNELFDSTVNQEIEPKLVKWRNKWFRENTYTDIDETRLELLQLFSELPMQKEAENRKMM